MPLAILFSLDFELYLVQTTITHSQRTSLTPTLSLKCMYHARKVSGMVSYICDRCIECASYLQYLFIGFGTVPCARQQSLTPIELA
jgi:hypothetical protein